MKRVTILDVAKKAGVSKSTVSHVINATRFVEEETKERVLQAIDELGYRPSTVARSLTTNRTQTIGVIVSDTSNNFFGEIIRGIDHVLGVANYSLLVCNTDEVLEREEWYLNLLLSQQVDGIIAAAASKNWDVLNVAGQQQMPVVFLDRTFEGMDEYPYVGVDNRTGAYQGTKHLIACGYREIGILAGFQRLSTMCDRLDGFMQALEEHAIPLPEEWVVTSLLGIEAGREAALRILSTPQRPRALFVSNNLLVLGTLLALKDLGLCCPQDVALVSFDDHPWTAVTNPPLTVVRQPVIELGEYAATIMLELLNGRTPSPSRVILDCELVKRESCGGGCT